MACTYKEIIFIVLASNNQNKREEKSTVANFKPVSRRCLIEGSVHAFVYTLALIS